MAGRRMVSRVISQVYTKFIADRRSVKCKETDKGRVVHERGFCERRAHGENGDGDLGLGFEQAITKK